MILELSGHDAEKWTVKGNDDNSTILVSLGSEDKKSFVYGIGVLVNF